MKGYTMKMFTQEDVLRLSVTERIQLAHDIWDTIPQSSEEPYLTTEQKKELDTRLESLEKNPSRGASWSAVRERVGRNS